MAPTILVVGATGNTGKAVVRTLSELIKSNKVLDGYHILALSRSASSETAQQLAKLPNVEFEEISWPEITSDWLQEREVKRAFIASHNEPTHFAEESTFLREALEAGVQYVVRISTTAPNVKSDCRAYYPRAHWAIEQLLDSPEYSKLHWSSLQPNIFTSMYLGSAAEYVKEYRKTGQKKELSLMAAPDVKNAPVHPDDVGVLAAHLLAQDDTSKYNKHRLVINGPSDITGRDIVKMVEEAVGAKVEKVAFQDLSFIDGFVDAGPYSKYSKNVIRSIKRAQDVTYQGKTTLQRRLKVFATSLLRPRVMQKYGSSSWRRK
jgi:uncharacterized protein YbjT (DUF2867 family)